MKIRFYMLPLQGFISIIFPYYKHFYQRPKICPLKIISKLDIIKSGPEVYFDFFPFNNQYNVVKSGKFQFIKIKKITLNLFCRRETFLTHHFDYSEESLWIFKLFKKYLDLASRIEIIFRNGYGSNLMDVMITWKAF